MTTEALAKEVAKIAVGFIIEKKGQALNVGNDNELAEGYYLIVDTTSVGAEEDKVVNASLLQVVGETVEITVKTDKPTLDKQIKHNEVADETAWGVVGDNQIGDTVEFRTITTVPDTTYYDTYTYKITDTMSSQLTSNVKTATDIEIKVNDTGEKLSTDYYTVTVLENSNSFELNIDIKKAIKDNKMKADDQLYSYYSGVLNEEAKVYDDGSQDNKARLEYSNNPDGDGTGKTNEVVVYDWTYKMNVNKVDEKGEALTGAKFVLSKSGVVDTSKVTIDEESTNNALTTESVTADLIKLIKKDNGVYIVAPENYIGETTYVIDDQAATIKGLDDAVDYYLYEIEAPSGYNKLTSPVQFKIATAYNETGDAVAKDNPTVTVGTEKPSTTLSTNVENKSGAQLPETGGIGTTIFYVLGAILVIGAGLVLVTKKRMGAEK